MVEKIHETRHDIFGATLWLIPIAVVSPLLFTAFKSKTLFVYHLNDLMSCSDGLEYERQTVNVHNHQ